VEDLQGIGGHARAGQGKGEAFGCEWCLGGGFEQDSVSCEEGWEDGVDGCKVGEAIVIRLDKDIHFILGFFSFRWMIRIDVLPWSDDKYDADRHALDPALETGLICVGERDIGEAGGGDVEHIRGTFECATYFTCTLGDGSVETIVL
jgi:hypothetical protein